MIIVEEFTEKALTERLEMIQKEATPARCVHFAFAGSEISADSAKTVIQKYIEEHIETTDQTQLFVCDDGDAYYVGQQVASTDMQTFIANVGGLLNADVKGLATIYELPAKIHPVLTSVDEKIQSKNAEIAQESADAEELKQEQKTKAILSVVDEANAKTNIINARKGREKPQIMVIEDDAFTRTLVTNIMKKQYHIEGTGVPMEALQMYVRLAPDVLFLDINLPDVTGHELLTRILELDPDAFVVMLSGNADKENITKAIGAGAKGFVGKPFTKEKLLQYIDKRLGT